MPLLRVQTSLQHPVAVSDRSFVRLCHILVCAVVVVIGVSSKMVIQRCGVGAHAVTHGVQELHRYRVRAAVIAIDAVGDLQLVLSTFLQAFDYSCIVHSRKFSVPVSTCDLLLNRN